MALRAQNIQADDQMKQLTKTEAAAILDARARRHLSISGTEFIRKWKRGEYDRCSDDSAVLSVAMLLPLVGEDVER